MSVTFIGSAATFGTMGNGQTTQNLFILENKLCSRRIVNIRSLVVQMDPTTGTLATVKPIINISRITALPNDTITTAGETLSKVPFDTAQVSDFGVMASGATLADGGPLRAIVASPGVTSWRQYSIRLASGFGQVKSEDNLLISNLIEPAAYHLYPGQAMLITVVSVSGANNPSTNRWFAQTVWEEETFNTRVISGTVTNNSLPVNGAQIVIVIADDIFMTNSRIWSTTTTNALGAWSANVPVGRVAAVYSQHRDGQTLHSAVGNPYLMT